MMILNRLTSGVLQFFVLIPFIFLSGRVLLRRDLGLILLVFCLFLFDNILLDLLSPIDFFPEQRWNWAGKLGSITWALAFAYFNPGFAKKEMGWTAKFR